MIKDYEAFLNTGKPDPAVEEVGLDDICQIYYTSGTTGEPKGVCLTYGNMIASAFDSIVGLELTRDDIWLHAAPMFHLVDAWSVWSMPLLGATQVMVHFTPERMMEVVQRARPTGAGVPPTLINMMANHPKIGQYDLSSLRLIMYGGSPTPLGILQKAAKALPTKYIHGYGITETSGITTLADPRDFCVDGTPEQLALTNNAGRPVPHIRLDIFDDSDRPLERGKVGEVVVSGARVMREYWKKPKHTAEALRNGWYHTGDMGYVDAQGRLFIVDRKKDMIISGGENVYSVEVESVLSTHPAVLEVAVIGVPDESWGEAVKAIVVLKDGAAVLRGRADRLLPRPDRRLQDAEVGGLRQGAAAEDRSGQDREAPAARSVLGGAGAQDMKLWFREGGEGEGPRLVLIHGLGANADVWEPLIRHIKAKRWLAPDLPGHGRSPHRAPYGYAGHAADVAGLLQQDEEVVILGHSMGGVVGMALASGWFGVKVRKVVAFGVKIRWTPDEVPKLHALARSPARLFETRPEAIERYLKVSGLFGLVDPSSPIAASGVREENGKFRLAADPMINAAAGPELAPIVQRDDMSAAPRRRRQGPDGERGRHAAFRSAALHVDGAGHNAQVERPADLWQIIRTELACIR